MSRHDERDDEARDTANRQRIRNEHHLNIMVEAAAGTGKTSSIVDRMVNLVGSGACKIESLVAVTFTRKAAAELRERFQSEIRKRAAELAEEKTPAESEMYLRLQSASDHVGRACVSTIHSFCAALLRERPVEFDIDPSFKELSDEDGERLQERAWQSNIDQLCKANDPLIDEIGTLGLERNDLKTCFQNFIKYRDVDDWPCGDLESFDFEQLRREMQVYISEMETLIPLFPTHRGNDKLMSRYEDIVRRSERGWEEMGACFRLLEKFDATVNVVQKQWHDNQTAKDEQTRWREFRERTVVEALDWWHRKRYAIVLQFVRRAVNIYVSLKQEDGGHDFTDLLQTVATGLKSQPQLRRYFQQRYTHVLVDEFQDTDPIQAELILYLTSENVTEQRWDHCAPRPGALFLVGDPKQSIYRFRRGDIVTYNRVKRIFEASGGEVLSLVKNFRSRGELLTWNNRVYGDKFLDEADSYTTAAEHMVQGRVDRLDGELAGVWRLPFAVESKIVDTTRNEAESIARFIRHAIDSGMTVPRSERELELGRPPTVQARDFLIIPRGKKHIDVFSQALDAYSIPCEVTGGNAYAGVEQLEVLVDCLRCIDDPRHPVHFLAILRHRLFGFSDAELYKYKRAGGRFSPTGRVPNELDEDLKKRMEEVHQRISRYRVWLRSMPFPVAIQRIASDLGLLAVTAAQREGDLALGVFLKAIEVLRSQSAEFDCAADLIDRFDQLGESEGCTALSPDQDVVRVMNLHKAKGLQAPVVFLADTSAPYRGSPECHIDRTGELSAGYMSITTKVGKWGVQRIANPPGWTEFEKEERRFLAAEADRLLYVATTRAACMMVVSVGKSDSNWSGLHGYLEEVPELVVSASTGLSHGEADPCGSPAETFPEGKSVVSESESGAGAIAERWLQAATASYSILSAKDESLSRTERPNWGASGEYGYRWGSAVHQLLDLAAKNDGTDLLPAARLIAREFEIGAARIDELVETVVSVTQSDIWARAKASARYFTELPFESIANSESGQQVLTRGLIDLVFEDASGWVIVDYKTDDISRADLSDACEFYRPQLESYAKHWHVLTGNNVVEHGLYFTRLNDYVGVV